ncbi:MAG: PmoA family protein, partial [Verrucomicrobiae bacterium]|nr:PmoA family protein [Verrucomicrobiae bacterium]
VPQPYHQISFQRDGVEITRYHFGPELNRPFIFPVIGPLGRPLTRMGHPHDPEGHSHHNSVWISHHDVNGANFWADRTGVRIVHQRIEKLDDNAVITSNAWLGKEGKPLLRERRRISVELLPNNEWVMILDLQLVAQEKEVTFGKTPFGLLGVRMAKSIGVRDGGGTIRNSEGGVNETNVLWKTARWVDYSGPITATATEGIMLMDHPSNPNHPTFFHVRDDGWMGASLTYDAPRTLAPGKPLQLRYGLYIHGGMPTPEQLQQRWLEFSRTKPFEFALPEKKPSERKIP